MKNKYFKKIALLALAMFSVAGASAQGVYVYTNNGNKVIYSASDVDSLVYFAAPKWTDTNTVYVAGYENTLGTSVSQACYWRNSKAVKLTASKYGTAATDICVSEDEKDVYVSGWVYDDSYKLLALLWHNEVCDTLSDPTMASKANAIAAIGSDIYVGGYASNEAGYKVATVW